MNQGVPNMTLGSVFVALGLLAVAGGLLVATVTMVGGEPNQPTRSRRAR